MTRPSGRLQAELQQTRPFRTPQQEAVIGILHTADHLRRRLLRAIEPAGISGQQYNVLHILRGSAPQAMPTLAIAARMIERTPGITRLLDRLERKGLVRRERCASDRRQVLCGITPAGVALLDRLDPQVERAEQEVLAGLGGDELSALIRILDRIRSCGP